MKIAIWGLSVLFTVGVLATMLLAIWSSSGEGLRPPTARRNRAMQFVWTAIPLLAVVAAAIPVTIAIAGPSLEPRDKLSREQAGTPNGPRGGYADSARLTPRPPVP